MSNIFDSVKSIVTKTAKDAVKASNDAVEFTKLKFKINELNDKINEHYAKIGKVVYESSIDDETDTDCVEQICTEIGELKQQLEQLQEELASVTNKTTCPHCNAKIDADSAYCAKCGEKI